MADIHKFTTVEALNTTAAGGHTIADASSGGLGGSSGASITAGASGTASNTKHLDLDSSTHQLFIYAAGDIYFNFATSDLDIDEDIHLILPGGSLTSVAVPVGIASSGDTIRFNFNSTSSTQHIVRIVEV
jgi:hypothetical protein